MDFCEIGLESCLVIGHPCCVCDMIAYTSIPDPVSKTAVSGITCLTV